MIACLFVFIENLPGNAIFGGFLVGRTGAGAFAAGLKIACLSGASWT